MSRMMILDWHCADGAEVPHTAVEDVTDGPFDPVRIADFYPNECSMEECEKRALHYIDMMVRAGLAQRPDAAWQARWYPEDKDE